MIYFFVVFIIFAVFFAGQVFFYKRYIKKLENNFNNIIIKNEQLREQEASIVKEVELLERSIDEYLFFYEMTSKIAPILGRDELFSVFLENIRGIADVEIVKAADFNSNDSQFRFNLATDLEKDLIIKTKSKIIIQYMPYFKGILKLCLQRVDLYEKLHQLSIYDSLTNVYNRRYFITRFGEEFERSKKHDFNVAYLMIDADNFKKINDKYGHLVGDAVLVDIAKLILESVREVDFVARFGGEEFAVVLTETDKSGAIMVAQRICSRIAQKRVRAFDEVLSVTVSVGLAAYPQNTLHSDVLVEVADKALYKAKESGKNKVCWF